MALSDIDRAAVLRTIEDFDRLGRLGFLKKHGFRRSRSYFLVHEGKPYDSKAIIGVAHGYSGGNRIPLSASDFNGGGATVGKLLRSLDFDLQVSSEPPAPSSRGNEYLCDIGLDRSLPQKASREAQTRQSGYPKQSNLSPRF